MTEAVNTIASAIIIGAGATAIMDLRAALQKRFFGGSSLDLRLLGRWIGHFRHRQFAHESISRAEPVPGERVIGMIAHYSIGVAFAGLLLAIWGLGWAHHPTPLPALIVGVGGIVAPFFIMQPCFGLGIASSKTARPWDARLRSLISHTSFAVGLYLSALALAALRPS